MLPISGSDIRSLNAHNIDVSASHHSATASSTPPNTQRPAKQTAGLYQMLNQQELRKADC